MYSIKFYTDKSGRQPVKEYISKLGMKTDKNSRINLNKINEYLKALSLYGKALGEPYIKHLEGEIWELRPLRNRILFFYYNGEHFILLSHFVKKTQKTPPQELNKAKRLMKDYKERSKKNEEQ